MKDNLVSYKRKKGIILATGVRLKAGSIVHLDGKPMRVADDCVLVQEGEVLRDSVVGRVIRSGNREVNAKNLPYSFKREVTERGVRLVQTVDVTYNGTGGREETVRSSTEAPAKEAESVSDKRCQGVTASDKQCGHDALEGSDYCAIKSHQAQGEK